MKPTLFTALYEAQMNSTLKEAALKAMPFFQSFFPGRYKTYTDLADEMERVLKMVCERFDSETDRISQSWGGMMITLTRPETGVIKCSVCIELTSFEVTDPESYDSP